MSFLLDTDVCSAYLKGDQRLWSRFIQHGGHLQLSAVTVGELFTWVLRANAPPKRFHAVLSLLGDVQILDVNLAVGRRFGEIRSRQLDAGKRNPTPDLLIAATALVHDLTLVTHNAQDFAAIPGLRIADWLAV